MNELILGQIPEGLFFALFMIFAKNIREKRILFTLIMVLEYVLIINAIPYSIYSHIGYFGLTYLTLKVLYKEKSQITDMFLLGIASIILMLSSALLYFVIWKTINNYLVYAILNRIILFLFLIFFNYKLYNLQRMYKCLWNRNDKAKRKIKSTTFRALNLVIFNFMFYFTNILLIYSLFLGRSV